MNTKTKAFHTFAISLSFLFLSIVLISCSGEEEKENHQFDHPHAKTTDMEKHLFEHEFAQQCVAKETAQLVDKEAGGKRFAKTCMCIARYLFKDLATEESYAMLNNKKHAQSLRIRYEDATEHCL